MAMAATGTDRKERHLAQPPRGFPGAARRRGLHFPIWVAAVLLVAALSLLIFPGARGEASPSPTATTVPMEATAPATVSASGMVTAAAGTVVPILFPLENRVSWTDTYGAARSGGRTHEGNDLMVPKMTPLLACVDGTVDIQWGSSSSYNGLPYYNLLLKGDDGNDYFYIHINNDTPGTDDAQGGLENAYAPGITDGTRVKAGQVIAYAGDSGNAEDADSHLHFEVHPGGYKNPINPYASLKAAPTLAEWTAAGKPPLASWNGGDGGSSGGGSTTTTTVKPPDTPPTTKPPSTTTTTTPEPTTKVPGFSDVLTTDWFYADWAQARAAGVVTDASDQRFRPYSKVSRALFAVYLVRTVALDELENAAAPPWPRFTDVDADHWAYDEIEIAARLGLIKGTSDGTTFSPDDLVTRAQMATMMCRALGFFVGDTLAGTTANAYLLYEDVPKGHWAEGAIVMIDYLGLMCGDTNGCFRPEEGTTRAQAITVMARLLRYLE
jgi:murein DD-endopeptidase MepM/ murein hydrolase activator NlpD